MAIYKPLIINLHSYSSQTFCYQTNSYQAVLVKSELRSYAIFTYQCGDIQWSNLNGDGASAVVGYNAAGKNFFNHEASGYSLLEILSHAQVC